MTRGRAFDGPALFAVLMVAKGIAIASVGAPALTEWPQMIVGDALIASLFLIVVRGIARGWVTTPLYFAIALHAAVAVAVVQAVGTPPGAAMLRGANATMSDSIAVYVNWSGLAGAMSVLAASLVLPACWRRVGMRSLRALSVVLVGLGVAGLFTPPPALPAHRNALLFFMRSLRALPDGAAELVARPAGRPIDDPALVAMRGSARGANVVTVVLESAAARFLRPFGAAEDPMPFITGLSVDSLLCTTAYAVYPESIKGQIALFHGMHPAPRIETERYARIPVPGLAEHLARAGYATAIFHAGRFRFLGMSDALARSGYRHRADAGDIGGERESSFGVDEESTVDALLRWIDQQGDRRFMVSYLPVAGHHPYDCPVRGPFPIDSPIDCYRNALHYADSAVKRLWDGLVARGHGDDTLLVIVGDHGEAFGEHDGNFGHTFAIWEENLRVPLLFRLPGASPSPKRIDDVISQVDIAPTILDLLGMDDDPEMEGSSILRRGTRPAMFFSDWGSSLVGMREGDLKLIADLDTGIDLLFDLQSDPKERCDLAPLRRPDVERLGALARAFFTGRSARARAW